jgi:23S rRNA (cytosine1962-C5)-methyltransferase
VVNQPHFGAGREGMTILPRATVSARGAERWAHGHPWIYASDVLDGPDTPGVAPVHDRRGRFLGQALYSPTSEIRLRLLERTDRRIDQEWWNERFGVALGRRGSIDATAYRVVHGEGDGLPSLIVDRYDRWTVVQLLSAGLETMRAMIVEGLETVLAPEGILLRNDAPVRRHERLPEQVELAAGTVPDEIEIREGSIRYLVAPRTGQKTGAFLDQRTNRIRAGELALPGGKALDCFAYHGSFALHLASRSAEVVALDTSADALARGARNAALNGLTNIRWQAGDAFEALRALERARVRFDTVVVDPPAFAKSRSSVPQALRGYREINLRAMRILAPGGVLITASCSFHVRRAQFEDAIAAAARDSGRTLRLVEHLPQGADHPEIITIPETGYLKGMVLREMTVT